VWTVVAVALLALGAAAVVVMHGRAGGARHAVTAPRRLGGYVQAPRLAAQLKAQQLRQRIIAESGGEAHNVVDAVYEDASGPGARSGPQIMLFIGGNLTGTSAANFIASFTGKLPGAAPASAGSLGGQAACAPARGSTPAECAWADDDTFGVLVSPTLGAAALARELRAVRPLAERPLR
jgi:hypothetical protein